MLPVLFCKVKSYSKLPLRQQHLCLFRQQCLILVAQKGWTELWRSQGSLLLMQGLRRALGGPGGERSHIHPAPSLSGLFASFSFCSPGGGQTLLPSSLLKGSLREEDPQLLFPPGHVLGPVDCQKPGPVGLPLGSGYTILLPAPTPPPL